MTRDGASVRLPGQVRLGGQARAGKILADLSRRTPYPLNVTVVLTASCDLACKHCLVADRRSSGELDTAAWVDVLDQLRAASVLRVTLTGGEVSLRQDLEDIVAAAVDRRFLVKVKSNAVGLGPDRMEHLVMAGLRHLDVSVYSDQAKGHDAFVGRQGAWQRTLGNARYFARLGGHVHVACNVMAWNQERLPHLRQLAEAEGFTVAFGPLMACRNDGCTDPQALAPSDEGLTSFLADEGLLDAQAVQLDKGRPADASLCGAGRSTAHITPEGDLLLCQRLPMVLGNVTQSPFTETWLESSVRLDFLALKWRDLPVCGTCSLSGLCWRCPASALLETGDLLGAAPSDCAFARALGEAVKRLRSAAAQAGATK